MTDLSIVKGTWGTSARSHSLPLALEDGEKALLRRTSSGNFRVAIRGRPGPKGYIGGHSLAVPSAAVLHPSPLGASVSRLAPLFDKFEIFFGKITLQSISASSN